MKLGDRVEDFTLIDDEGKPWTLAQQLGQPVLLIFHRHLM